MEGGERRERVWTQPFTMHSYEVDFRQQATVEVLCRLLQEAAWNHAELLGVGYLDLQQNERFWVLSRLLVQIQRLPRWAETVVIHTWPRPADSLFAMRDFEVQDAQSQCVAVASSAWLIVDAKTKRPLRARKVLESFSAFEDRRATEADPGKVPDIQSPTRETTLTAVYTDVDVNRHVNAARYVGWILNSYPMEFHAAHALRRIEINYLGETFAGDKLGLISSAGSAEHLHSIRKSEDQREVCRARLSWV